MFAPDPVKHRTQRGFTAADVIFTCAILSLPAITILFGSQQIHFRQQNTNVRNDLAHAALNVEVFKAHQRRYPTSTAELNTLAADNFGRLSVNRDSYAHSPGNFAYCYNTSGTRYGFAAISVTGAAFYITNRTAGVTELSPWPTSLKDLCSMMTGIDSSGLWGYSGSSDAWTMWAAV